ncbi:MAG TPA: cytochrome c oxidase assembly protein [Thermoanaerobaculia bacterium]|nr:cytochrome c oxidase assembly protein [Thermoanaerobaculia bacterium]
MPPQRSPTSWTQTTILAPILAFLLSSPAFAHGGERHLDAGTVLGWWTWDPFVLLLLTASGWLYAAGAARLWERAGVGSGIRRWEAACFAAGWLALFAALVSPLDALGGILFSAHMAQHEVLILIAAPLLVLGRPLATFLWALPMAGRERAGKWAQAPPVARIWRFLTAPLSVWVIHGLALWAWHVPGLYQATLDDDFLHALQHLSFFGSAALFWWSLIHGRFGRLGYGAAVLYVFTTSMHSGVLGALLTFAPRLWYPIYEARTSQWGLSALEDQQLAGLIMWVPAGIVFIVLGLALFAAWLGEAERRVAHTRSEMMLRAVEGGRGNGV